MTAVCNNVGPVRALWFSSALQKYCLMLRFGNVLTLLPGGPGTPASPDGPGGPYIQRHQTF